MINEKLYYPNKENNVIKMTSGSLSIDDIYSHYANYKYLAAAMVKQTIKDYIFAKVNDNKYLFDECMAFFNSEEFEFISDTPADRIIPKADKVADKIMEDMEYNKINTKGALKTLIELIFDENDNIWRMF